MSLLTINKNKELKKGIDSLDKGKKYSDEEVYKELDNI